MKYKIWWSLGGRVFKITSDHRCNTTDITVLYPVLGFQAPIQ